MKRIIEALLLLLLLLGLLSVFIYIFLTPMNLIDDGQFGAWVTNMSYEKKMYRDTYITYGPLYVFLNFIVYKFFSLSFFGIRLFNILLGLTIGVPAIFFILKELQVNVKLSLFGTFYSLFLIPYFSVRQSVGLWAILIHMKVIESKKIFLAFVEGVLLALSFLVSPEIGLYVFVAVTLTTTLEITIGQKNKQRIKAYFFLLLGSLFSLSLFSIWAYFDGWLLAFTVNTLDLFKTLSGSDSPLGKNYPNIPKELFEENIIKNLVSQRMVIVWILFINIVLILYNILILFAGKRGMRDIKIFLLSCFTILISTTLIGRNGYGHILFVMPTIVLMLVVFFSILIEQRPKTTTDKVVRLILVLLILTFLARIVSINKLHFYKIFNFQAINNLTNHDIKTVGSIPLEQNEKREFKEILLFVAQNTTSNDSVFFLKDEAGMYMLVNRKNATSFDLPFIASSPEKGRQLLQELKESEPKYIFENLKAWDVDEISNRKRIPMVDMYINQYYFRCDMIGNVVVFCRK